MSNCLVNYELNQDGVITEDTLQGVFERVGSLYRVTFNIESDNQVSAHSYVKVGDNAFKISVKGDSEYSITVKAGETCSATLKTGGINFPFTATTKKCVVTANDGGMELYAEYYLTAFNQTLKNTLTVKVSALGELKC